MSTFDTLARLLDLALALPPAAQKDWLEQLPPEHDAEKPRLRRLLALSPQLSADRFLETLPPLEGEPAAPAEGPGARIGPYRLVRQLGAGGMGTVWLAAREDGLIKRPVALKLPHGTWHSAGLAERIAREREILAALDHPNIARLYDAGVTASGQPYLALEYVPGRPIDEYCREHALDLKARLHLFLQMVHAVAHAHAKLVVHRDLKPANVLVSDDGQVRLLDFGVAKLLEPGPTPEQNLTELVGCPLTPDYASPEQIAGQPITIHSDVYSLGVLLFELVTGKKPYRVQRGTRAAMEAAIRNVEPAPPSQAAADPRIARALRGDLDTIIAKALKKAPEERYPTADSLGEDIARHLGGEPVLARPDGSWYRLGKLVRRHRLAVAAGAAVLLSVVFGAGAALWQARVALAQARRAEAVKELISSIIRDSDPYANQGQALSAVNLLTQAKKRIESITDAGPDVRVELLNTIGWSLLAYGETASAETVVGQAIHESMRDLGPDHPQTLRARVLGTIVLRYRGRTREMREELSRLLPALRSSPRADPRDLVRALRNSANLAIHEGNTPAAILEATEALALSRSRYGERDPETATSSRVLALARSFGHEPALALAAAEQALRLTLAVYGGNAKHPSVSEARAFYGRALAGAGRYRESSAALVQAAHDAGEVFGESSMVVGFYQRYLAECRLAAGEIETALESSERATRIIAAHAGADSSVMAAALRVRGEALLAAGRSTDALPYLARAYRTFQHEFGPSHELTVATSASLARARDAAAPAEVSFR